MRPDGLLRDSTLGADDLSYLTPVSWELPAAVCAILTAGGVVALVASIVTAGPWPFLVAYLGMVAYVAWGFLYRRAYIVRISDGVLSWHGCAYHGSQPMSALRAVTLGAGATYTWSFSDGTRMSMMAFSRVARTTDRVAVFLDKVAQAYPEAQLPGYPSSR